MKLKKLLLVLGFSGAIGFTASFAQSQLDRSRAAKEFMRAKLGLAQSILEGLATENYDLVIINGEKLSAMSRRANWRLFENPEYDQHSLVFRQHMGTLVKAAKDKNLDGATLAYVRMTMSCIDCHKHVRGKLVASSANRASRTIAATGR